MFFQQWEILLVDDEPDVLTISKMAMRNFEVYGLPLKIHTAGSKAEALELINNRPDRHAPVSSLAVAFIDVVMENDSAGLELCQVIREEMDNKLIQLFIRTGQPGVVPERTVIDRYDINGYFTKAEATEDKLYSLVKSGVRQHFWAFLTRLALPYLNMIIAASGSKEKLTENFQFVMQQANAASGSSSSVCYLVDDTVIFRRDWDEQTARSLIAKLDQEPGTSLSDVGDKFVTDEDGHLLIKVASQPGRAEVKALINTAFTPPIGAVGVVHSVFSGLGTAWQLSDQ